MTVQFSSRSSGRAALPVVSLSTLGLLSSALLAQSGAIAFTEVTDTAGVGDALRSIAPGGRYDIMSGGGVAGDFNNDGHHDLFVLAGGGYADYLFINNGDGSFTDHAHDWGVDLFQHAFGASAADFNNDGYLDIFVTSYGSASAAAASGKMKLYMNNGPDGNGQWSFTDVAQQAGVNRLFGNTRDGLGSGWGDYDLDGDLDLFVCGYNDTQPCNRLFRNNGPDGDGIWTFTDATAQAGLEHDGVRGFIPSFVDMNGDRYPELIHIADSGTSRYYNNNNAIFADVTADANGIETANGMGVDVGDINNDGLLDMYVASITYPTTNGPGNVMMLQNPDGSYTNTARQAGTYSGHWGWGVLILDLDHDGDRDIAETNGYTGEFAGDPAVLFENTDAGEHFSEVAQQAGFIHTGQGRGMVRLDIENDGDMDIAIFEYNGRLRLYRNDLITGPTPPDRHWVRVTLGTRARGALAPGGIGAMVRVTAGGQTQLLPMHSGSNHASSSPIEVHAGLGEHGRIDAVQVQWPDGSYTTVADADADRVIHIEAPATPVDYAPDAVTDVNDIIAFTTRYANSDLSADHNGDGHLNFFDVAAFISDYQRLLIP